MAAYLSPVFNGQTFIPGGSTPASGYKLFTYVAGSSQKLTTYTDSAGTVAQSNPIILNTAGYPTMGPIWQPAGALCKYVLTGPNDTDPPTSPVKTIDSVPGVNDPSAAASNQWQPSGFTPTYVSANTFTLSGDQTTNFHAGRRLQLTTTAGTVYGGIKSSTFTTLTTVIMSMDGASVLDSGLSVVNVSIIRSDNSPIGFQQSGAGAVARIAQDKLRETVSVKDFGAVVDGVTDDTAAVTAANSAGGTITVPSGLAITTLASTALSANFTGPGQLKTGTNKRGKYFSAIGAAPSSLGNHNSVETAFNGDLSHSIFQTEHRITGTATLGQPTTGYLYRPEAMPYYTYMYNSSGWNQGTADDTGRTGAAAYRTVVAHYGQGDAVCYNGSVFVSGARAGATAWLANPAGVLFNGDMTAGADGIYFNPYEVLLDDNAFDVSATGLVTNFYRSKNAAALGQIWNGVRMQSKGAKPCDAMYSGVGQWTTGLDLAMSSLDFGANKGAISLKANDRMYFNASALASGTLGNDWRTTVFNGDYITYSSVLSGLNFVVAGGSVLQMTAAQTSVTNNFKHTGTSLGFFNTTPANKPAVTGSRGGNAALQGVLAALASLGLLTDNSTA